MFLSLVIYSFVIRNLLLLSTIYIGRVSLPASVLILIVLCAIFQYIPVNILIFDCLRCFRNSFTSSSGLSVIAIQSPFTNIKQL